MIKKWRIKIPSLTGAKTRRAYIYVPDEAFENPEARYPVLYMFDGHNVFFDSDATYGKSWGMAEYVEETKLPMIIAAVECNHSPDNGRLSEYSPFTFRNEEVGRVVGRGQTYMEWRVNRFKPLVDRKYPTIPDREHTFIAGSSMGGLMSLFAVTVYNHTFSRAACLSPSVWFARRRLDEMLCNADIAPGTMIYMDYGENEINYHPDMKRQFGAVAARLIERGALLNCRIVPGGEHCEACWEQQIPYFMDMLLYEQD